MLGWVVQVTVISLCFIAVVHYLYIFFKTTLTVPKVKDLVNRPQQQYEELFKGITHTSMNPQLDGSHTSIHNNNNNNNNNTTSISALPPLFEPQEQNRDQTAMKDELKQFLKKLNNK